MKTNGRRLWLGCFFILVCALVVVLGGAGVRAASQADGDQIDENLRKFAKVLATIEDNYASEVESDKAIYHGAIPQMLRVLDPHSSFFDPDAFKQLRDDQKGRYAGVGMQIGNRDGGTVVIAPFPRTPAYRAGLRPGDVIVEVDKHNVEDLTVGEVADRLRGPVDTEVLIGIERRGLDEMIEFTVVRAEIPRPSVPTAFQIEPGVGFIRIDTFNENTGRELDKALEKFDFVNLKGIILDMRENRGGLLSEGVRVSDRFLEKGQTIVSHHGRASQERSYTVRKGNDGKKFPMVVMVNCNSASASEIVAGAMQDHDRALVVGHSTFGKGLVQTVYPLSETSGLALTTARYYTPSGRLIQRRYDGVSMIDYYSNPCSEGYQPNQEEVRLTDKGRRVFAGGGITPDVTFEERRPNDFQWMLVRQFVISTFAQDYTREHSDLPQGWDVTDDVVEEFRLFLNREKIEYDQADFIENIDFIKRFIKREVYNSAYDIEEGQRVYYELDPDVQQAVKLLPKAKELLKDEKNLIAANRITSISSPGLRFASLEGLEFTRIELPRMSVPHVGQIFIGEYRGLAERRSRKSSQRPLR